MIQQFLYSLETSCESIPIDVEMSGKSCYAIRRQWSAFHPQGKVGGEKHLASSLRRCVNEHKKI